MGEIRPKKCEPRELKELIQAYTTVRLSFIGTGPI